MVLYVKNVMIRGMTVKKVNTKRKINPLTCSKCKKTKPADKYFPYCGAEHWSIAVRAEPE